LPEYTFPELDLALQCIDLYFKHDNLYLPLLHRPIFDKSVQEGLYLRDKEFAPVFLLVCAVGARYSDDPRVLLDGFDSQHSSGWKWFSQVQKIQMSLITPPTLYDLQRHCVGLILDWVEAQLKTVILITAMHQVSYGFFFSAVMLDPGGRCYSFSAGRRRPSKKSIRSHADTRGGTMETSILVRRTRLFSRENIHSPRQIGY
jgi:hypothetical protein